jgi:hypothetical protein
MSGSEGSNGEGSFPQFFGGRGVLDGSGGVSIVLLRGRARAVEVS